MHPHKVVQYIEDSSSQHDDTADDSDYYPSSQASQDSLLQMGIKRIESIYKVEERRKEKMKPSKEVEEFHYTEVENIKEIEENGINPIPEKRTCPVPDELNFKGDDKSEELDGGIFW